jgi:hypothetical protein
VLYPEDFDKTAELKYKFTVTCAGIITGSALESQKGKIEVVVQNESKK